MEIREFVRTPFAVRRNVVKVWQPLPAGLWTALTTQVDQLTAARRERTALVWVACLALVIVVGASVVELVQTGADDRVTYPLIGKAESATASGRSDSLGEGGWRFVAGRSALPALWAVIPSLCGWGFVRLMWIPLASRGAAPVDRQAMAAFARFLSGVYLYVYAMITTGLLVSLILLATFPCGSDTFRWLLWLFLFGESFFVPALVWIRMVCGDSTGGVFGQRRYAVLIVYLILFVLVPIAGMVPIAF